MKNFKTGQIVKSTERNKEHELFVMVLDDPNPNNMQFNGVVLEDFSRFKTERRGFVANNWNTKYFKLSNWDEFRSVLFTNELINSIKERIEKNKKR